MSDKTAKSVKCVRDIRKFPPDNYWLPGDGRKWLAVAKERRALAIQLATYANGDGSNITVGTARMVRELGWSRATLFRRLDDLEKLGLLSYDGEKRKGQHGTRYRKLNREVFGAILESQIQQKPESQIAPVAVSDSRVGVSDSILGVSDRDSRSLTIRETQPTYLTDKQTVSTNRPSNQDGWLAQRLTSILRRAPDRDGNTVITPTAEEVRKMEALTSEYGDLNVLLAFYYCVNRNRGLAGIAYPYQLFFKEAEDWVALAAKEAQKREHTEAMIHRVADLMDEHDLESEATCLGLCELAYLEAELNDSDKYDLAIVRDYLAGHYELKAIEPVAARS